LVSIPFSCAAKVCSNFRLISIASSFKHLLPLITLIGLNIHPIYAEDSLGPETLQNLLGALPQNSPDMTEDSSPGAEVNTFKTGSDRINNLQPCITKNTNIDSTNTQTGIPPCTLSTGNNIYANLSGSALIFCQPSVVIPLPCAGTRNDDIIYGARTTEEIFAFSGNDMIFANAADTRMFGMENDDLIVAGPGNDLVAGGPDDDVLLAGAGSDLLVGGRGNDKLFNGAGTSIMYGGKGANHFDCSLSALGLARSVVMDYNPSKGDTIAGQCKLVNTLDGSNNSERIKGIPRTPLPDTGEASSGGSNEIIAGLVQ
jgi:hypothetical protein